jgi:hypothetical protein
MPAKQDWKGGGGGASKNSTSTYRDTGSWWTQTSLFLYNARFHLKLCPFKPGVPVFILRTRPRHCKPDLQKIALGIFQATERLGAC